MSQLVNYYNEISLMMFGFGDSHEPNPETIRLVESITLEQLRLIIQEALKYQKGDVFNGEEFVFLLRKNKYKMRRFVKYLYNKETVKKAEAGNLETPMETPPKNKLIDFIKYIDETGELTNLSEFDEVKHDRMVRADQISIALNEENYIKFAKARRTSFYSKKITNNTKNLKMWLDPKNEFNFTNAAMDVLAYLTYDTVAQLMDYALLVRMDTNRTSDPLGNLQGNFFSASMFSGDHRFGGQQNPDYSKVYSGNPAISPAEIREVMRRVYMPQVGKLNFGRRLPNTHHILAL